MPSEQRYQWIVGQRVSRKDTPQAGTVVEVSGKTTGKIKVKWDSGQTSYFTHGDEANVQLETPWVF